MLKALSGFYNTICISHTHIGRKSWQVEIPSSPPYIFHNFYKDMLISTFWSWWTWKRMYHVKLMFLSEKAGLKLNIQITKTMGPSLITSWQTDGEKMETVTDFIFLGSKITADSDCSHEIRRLLLLRRKVMTNLDSILKSRDITLPTKAI